MSKSMSLNCKAPHKLKKCLVIAAACLLCVAVGAVIFFMNISSTVALEQELRCGMTEHVHINECYEGDFLVCEQRAHSHNANCYILLLNQNDINNILTMLDEGEKRSLEEHISDTLQETDKGDSKEFSKEMVTELNEVIKESDYLPYLVLNTNINTLASELAEEITTDPVTERNKANVYIYLDGAWICIGNIDFTTARNGNRYNSTIPTSDFLEFVNGILGTEFYYNSFDIAVSSSENGNYSKSNIGIGSTTTIIGYRQNNTNATATKYIRLIPNNGNATSTAFAFSTVKYVYPNGSTVVRYVRNGTTVTLPEGNYEWRSVNGVYASGEAVTVNGTVTFYANTLGPLTNVSIHYDVNFPNVSGVTIETGPTIAGTSSTLLTDSFAENSMATIRNVSNGAVEGSVDENNTGLSRVIYFKGWQVGDSDVILKPNTALTWEELVNYSGGVSGINLTGVWEYSPLQTASFFVRFDSVAVDTEGNITGQDSNLYTNELFAAYVGGVDTSLGSSQLSSLYQIADTTADNSYGADQEIRALYGEKTEGVWLSAFPTDDYIFESLKKYAETGYLSVDGVPVKAEDLNKNGYAIRWYVFKSQTDAWHIDGKLVKKEGIIHVYKSFAGNRELIENAKDSFYINALDVNSGNESTLDLSDYKSYDSGTDTYMWELTGVEYDEMWQFTEYSGLSSSEEHSVYSEYTVMDSHGDQSTVGEGTTVTVKGVTYAIDEGIDTVLRVEYNNIYNRSDSIIIKKQDARTGVSIGGATFMLMQNGKPMTFVFDSTTNSYRYSDEGEHTTLTGSDNGYFEIAIEIDDFSYDQGNITVCEMTAPNGYTPVGNIDIGYIDDAKSIGIIGGNSAMVRYVNGVLIIGNSTESSSVTVKKEWECDESECQDVKLELLANGKLVTSTISGVVSEVVLNDDNSWSYTWDNLPVYVNGNEIEWSVREIMIGDEQCKSDHTFVNWLVSYSIPVYSTDADGNQNVLLTVTNTTKRVMLRLTKTDISKLVQLKGAEFTLEAVDENGEAIPSEIVKTATTGDAGTLVFDNLKCNVRYRLTENTAPDGYLKTDEYIYFQINEDGSVEVEESYYAEAGGTAYNIIVRNAEVIPLPGSGGEGMIMFYVIGAVLIAAAFGIYIYTFGKRRCKN